MKKTHATFAPSNLKAAFECSGTQPRNTGKQKPNTPMKRENMERALVRIKAEMDAIIEACPHEVSGSQEQATAFTDVVVAVRHVKKMWSHQ